MKTKLEIQNKYGNDMTKKKLYYGTCIRLHNIILEVDTLYTQFRDCGSSDIILENIKTSRTLLKLAFEEALNEAREKWKTKKKLIDKLEKSAFRYFKFEEED